MGAYDDGEFFYAYDGCERPFYARFRSEQERNDWIRKSGTRRLPALFFRVILEDMKKRKVIWKDDVNGISFTRGERQGGESECPRADP